MFSAKRFDIMRKTARVSIFLLLMTSAAVFAASAQIIDDYAEIRSGFLAADGGTQTFDASSFQGFYYDPEQNVMTEKITVDGNAQSATVAYETHPVLTKSKAVDAANDTVTYPVVGYFGAPYVACGGKADQLARLIADDDGTYLLKEGEGLGIGGGYIVVAKEIDTKGRKFRLELWKNGKTVGSEIISLPKSAGSQTKVAWAATADVLSEKNMTVMRLYVTDIFHNGNTNIVTVEGVWLIDWLDAFEIRSDDKNGSFEAAEITGEKLIYKIENVRWAGGADKKLTDKWFLKADKTTPEKICLYEKKSPGRYGFLAETVRGEILSGTVTDISVDADSFPAFWYDSENGLSTEKLTLSVRSGTVPKGGFVYTSTVENRKYDMSAGLSDRLPDESVVSDTYRIAALFGDPYVSVSENGSTTASGVLAELIADTDEEIMLNEGDVLRLGKMYTLIPSHVNADGGKVILELRHNGTVIDSGIVRADTESGSERIWIGRQTILGREDAEICRVFVKDIFQSGEQALVTLGGIWLIDAENAFEPESGAEYGDLEFVGLETAGGKSTFRFVNTKPVTIGKTAKDIGGGFAVRASDDASVFFVSLVRTYETADTMKIDAAGAGGAGGDAPGIIGIPVTDDLLEALKDQIEKIEMTERGEWPPETPDDAKDATEENESDIPAGKESFAERLADLVRTLLRWLKTLLSGP